MCGICGLAGSESGSAADRELLAGMTDVLRHRGPDDHGSWWSDDGGSAGFGHARLSIIDCSAGGHQPMIDRDTGTAVALNGEIYNYLELRAELLGHGHVFRSDSDTEVLLRGYLEWGTAVFARLNGMFAVAIHDPRRRLLLLARDRAGEKPLFYRRGAGRLAFGSELKSLLRDPRMPRVLSPHALNHYLAYGYVPGAECMLEGFEKLLPAHVLEYDIAADTARTWPYWTLPDFREQPVASDASLVDELEGLIESAVRLQLRADVPVGILLSGGLDSSIITAMAARVSAGAVRTFTIGFPGHAGYDESPYARLVAAHVGAEHMTLVAEPSTVELLPQLARQYDQPIADSSMVPTYLVSRLIREHATVALGGDGGDELFGGYAHHAWILQHERWRRRLGPLATIAGSVARRFPAGVRGRNYFVGLGGSTGTSIAHTGLYFDAAQRRALAPLLRAFGPDRLHAPESSKASLAAGAASPLQQVTRVDFMTYLVDDILTKVDRASMLTSLEVRAPWLDHRIVEFAFGRVPDRLRATEAERKVLPRMLGRRLLPPALDLRRKQGFSLPLHSWFKGNWGDFMIDVLRSAPSDLFERTEVERLVRQQRRGLRNTHRLFALVMLELWRREYQVGLP
jgi:asparagine synthase (glutamine-hydrolysing)